MAIATRTSTLSQLLLDAETAADLMTPNPVSVRQDATPLQAADILLEKDISAVPVLDNTGRPVGVLSRTDIVRHFRETAWAGRGEGQAGPTVRELMTPALLSVSPQSSALEVVAQLLGLGNVHRLFVVDDAGALVGVVSARDVLRRLRRPEAE